MANVRTLDSSFRWGALLAGIPLLLAGLIPVGLDPLVFSWDIAKNMEQWGILVVPAAGLMIIAAAVLPGLPRAARAILMLIFSVAALVAVGMVAKSSMPADARGVVEGLGWRVWIAVAAPIVAALFEFLLQGRKTSNALSVLAMLGWAGILAQPFIPADGHLPVEGLIEMLDHIGGLPLEQIALLGSFGLLMLVSFASFLFAFLRLVRSPEFMISAPWRSGFAGIFVAGWSGLTILTVMLIQALDAGETSGVLAALVGGFAVWGLSLSLPVAMAHTLLGFTAAGAPVAARYTGSTVAHPSAASSNAAPTISTSAAAMQEAGLLPNSGQAFQPSQQPAQAQPQYQQPAQPQGGHTPYQQPAAQPQHQQPAAQPQYQQPAAQPQYQQPAQPQYQQPAAPPAPAGPPPGPVRTAQSLGLAPYPGYAGYFICPNNNCRGGVAGDATRCTHCGQAF